MPLSTGRYLFVFEAKDIQRTIDFGVNYTGWSRAVGAAGAVLGDEPPMSQVIDENGTATVATLVTQHTYEAALAIMERECMETLPKLAPPTNAPQETPLAPFEAWFGGPFPSNLPVPSDEVFPPIHYDMGRWDVGCNMRWETAKDDPAECFCLRIETQTELDALLARKNEFLHLRQLRLDVSNVPPEIGSFQQLQLLELQSPNNIPTELGYLRELRWLKAEESKVQFLPTTIKHLKKLIRLEMSLGRLRCLPEEIGQCTSLQVLNIYGNRLIESLPDSIGELTELRRLNIGYNQLLRLPTTMKQLTKLESLGLHACESLILDEPGPLVDLPNLQKIDLSSVPGLPTTRVLPTSLVECEWPFSFSTHLPMWFAELTSLTALELLSLKVEESERQALQAAMPHLNIDFG